MTFPDQSHINRVRDALWQRSSNGASVMVGSGFSRNSLPKGPHVASLPTWDEVTSKLHNELYPDGEITNFPNQLRAAQEYEAAFGRGALHEALRRLVRHDEHHPGALHRRLLQMPWSDVFTTNWDTLMERTSSDLVERRYSIVNNVREIPMGKRPRIVKLHGSFPAHLPLIVTEEDYRTYPTKFAPFVNTVQQAMMETVLLLIGFSGDDPNFLNWSGWVRDNLGQSAQKIYLAGYLELSPHRRRMLEERHIAPIDLAYHPSAKDWTKNARPENAIRWILHSLENGEPYKITEWPNPSAVRQHQTPDQLQPVAEISTTWPKGEPSPSNVQNAEDVDSSQPVRDAVAIWKHNREIYPGWLVLPASNRQAVSMNTELWTRAILQCMEHLAPLERLRTIRELLWRKRILLEPFDQGLLEATENAVVIFDCQLKTIDGEEAPGADWETIRENYRNIAIELLVDYRWDRKQESFFGLIEKLRAFAEEDAEIQQHIFHEQCLWMLYDLNFEQLGILVTDWQTQTADPVWSMRKSALLSEMGRDDEAEQLRQRTIESIKAMPTDVHSLAGQSLEGWAILPTYTWHRRHEISGRLEELAALKCDAVNERDAIARGIDRSKREGDPPAFDVGTRTVRDRFYTDYRELVAAYRAVRLSEIAGLPAQVMVPHEFGDDAPPVRVPSEVAAAFLKKAADKLVSSNRELAIRLALRACNSDRDSTLGRTLTRMGVATLTTHQSETLAQSCIKAIASAIPRSDSPILQSRFRVATEALSRMVARLKPEQVETIFNQALELCQNPQLARGTEWTPIRHLLHRSWESLPSNHRRSRAMELLNAPIAGQGGQTPLGEYSWPDPADVLIVKRDALERIAENEQQWRAAIDLLERSLEGEPSVRHRASTRTFWLLESGQLSDAEMHRFACALWAEKFTALGELPGGTALYDWGFLTAPEPSPGMAVGRFRDKWLSDDVELTSTNTIEITIGSSNGLNHNPKDTKSRLWQIGSAIKSLRESRQHFALSDSERKHVALLVRTWADDQIPERLLSETSMESFRNGYRAQVRAIAQVLPTVARVIDSPDPNVGEKIYEKLRHLTDLRIPAFDLCPTVAQLTPTRVEDVATLLRVGLASDIEDLAASAASGIHLWLSESSDPDSNTPSPPDDLVREIGLAIAYRRRTSLSGCMQAARWIFENGTESNKEVICGLATDGLRYLTTELSYDRHHEDPEDIPLLRLLTTEMAVAMAKDGLDSDPAVAEWLESAKGDPLPEVRNTASEWLPRTAKVVEGNL